MTLLKRLLRRQNGPTRLELRLFLEAMIIMMAADGQVDDHELTQFMVQVQKREELRSLTRKEIENYMQEASLAIKKEGAQNRIEAIARGLTSYEQRMAAVGMALSIALSEREMARAEKAVLRNMQEAFGLNDRDLEQAIEETRRGLRKALEGENAPPEQYYIEVMMLMTAADGQLDTEELEHFGHQLAYHEEFEQITPDQVGVFMERSLKHLAEEGVENRLGAVAQAMPDPEQRLTAFRLALEICLSDGSADDHERVLLKLLQEKFELGEGEVEAMIQHILGKRR